MGGVGVWFALLIVVYGCAVICVGVSVCVIVVVAVL